MFNLQLAVHNSQRRKRSLGFGILIFSLLSAVSFLLLIETASAVSIFWQAPSEVGVGQEFTAILMIDPFGREINAIEGEIPIPPELEVLSLNFGNSLISLWVEKPAVNEKEKIVFSGIVPGGYSGELGPFWKGYRAGEVLRLVLKPESFSQTNLSMDNFSVLLNDGLGTKSDLNLKNHLLIIKPEIQAPLENFVDDLEPPEKFSIELVKNDQFFDGQWSLIFSAQDKDSGISHYEVREEQPYLLLRLLFRRKEMVNGNFYLLKDQELKSRIRVLAVDYAGNLRESVLEAQNRTVWYQDPSYWFIIFFIIGTVLWGSRYVPSRGYSLLRKFKNMTEK